MSTFDITDLTIPGPHGDVPLRRYAPTTTGPSSSPPFLWVHGGGFAHGSIDMPESHAVASAIAETGRTVVTVDYRRVKMWNIFRAPRPGTLPGIHFPVPLDDVATAFDYVQAASPDSGVILGGASAGACLAAGETLRRRDAGSPAPSGLVFAYGLFHGDLPPARPDLRNRLRGLQGFGAFSPAQVSKMTWNYAGSLEALTAAYALPGGHDLTGLPTTLMLDADHDTLRASGNAFHDELVSAGVKVDYSVVADSKHGYFNKPRTRSFDDGIRRLTSWLNENV